MIPDFDDEALRKIRATVNDPFIRAGARAYAVSERWAGFEDGEDPRLDTADRSLWPWHSRALDRLGDLLHDIGTRRAWKRK